MASEIGSFEILPKQLLPIYESYTFQEENIERQN